MLLVFVNTANPENTINTLEYVYGWEEYRIYLHSAKIFKCFLCSSCIPVVNVYFAPFVSTTLEKYFALATLGLESKTWK